MNTNTTNIIAAVSYVSLGLLLASGSVAAQDAPAFSSPQQEQQQQDQTPHPWRRAGDTDVAAAPDQDASAQNGAPNQAPPPPPPNFSANQNPGPAPYPQQPGAAQQYPAPPPDNYAVPASLTITPGTYVTVRVNQWLSSDRNQQGDAFFATLSEPVIVNGVVVAQRGQTVSGRVTQAQKAGRVEGTSKLGLELTGLTLVDGQQLSIQSQMINRTGPTSTGRDAGAVAGTTALGAAIGAGADWGRGAAIGAGAGAAAGILGVLLTRGRPTVIYPESVLTFRMTTAATVDTTHAQQAFRYVEPQDYNARGGRPQGPAPRIAGAPCYNCGPSPYGAAPYAVAPPYYYGPSYYPYPYSYYGGPGFSVFFGRPWYYGGYRGFRR